MACAQTSDNVGPSGTFGLIGDIGCWARASVSRIDELYRTHCSGQCDGCQLEQARSFLDLSLFQTQSIGAHRAEDLLDSPSQLGKAHADLVALGIRLGWVGADDKEKPAVDHVERLCLAPRRGTGRHPRMAQGGRRRLSNRSHRPRCRAHGGRDFVRKRLAVCGWPTSRPLPIARGSIFLWASIAGASKPRRHGASCPAEHHDGLTAREKLGEPLATARADDGLDEVVAALRTFALIDCEAIVDERDASITTEIIRLHRLVRGVAAARCKGDSRDRLRRAPTAALAAVQSND
jgi:hypothetical protein